MEYPKVGDLVATPSDRYLVVAGCVRTKYLIVFDKDQLACQGYFVLPRDMDILTIVSRNHKIKPSSAERGLQALLKVKSLNSGAVG